MAACNNYDCLYILDVRIMQMGLAQRFDIS